jgi:hypothetical protein
MFDEFSVDTMNNQSTVELELKQSYSDLLVTHREEGETVLLSHFGIFSQDLINSIASSVEEVMIFGGEIKKTVKRTFSILIEGLQNVYRHGALDEEGNQTSFVIVSRNTNELNVIFGNLVEEQDTYALSSYLEKINGLDSEQLKMLYLEILSKDPLSKKGGAGLGFLTMIMKSEYKLKYRISAPTNNRSTFFVEVTLNRS